MLILLHQDTYPARKAGVVSGSAIAKLIATIITQYMKQIL
jgi:hypothetical protein